MQFVVVSAQSHRFKNALSFTFIYIIRCAGGGKLPEKNMDVTEQITKIGETINHYRETVMKYFKDTDVDIKEWQVSVKKMDKEYDIDINLKLGIKPKKA
jgi:hypothetical protein